MADANEPSPPSTHVTGEQWTIADLNQLQVLFDLLAIPALPGYRRMRSPLSVSSSHQTVSSPRYPVHA
jgi:hypothetical protein